MKITYATEQDFEWVREKDRHLHEQLILPKIKGKEIYLLQDENGEKIGWMRYGYFWDNTPFMNMIWIEEPYRSKGFGKITVDFWENEMKRQGHTMVMTSTQADEGSQHFYRKLGYKDSGCLILDSQALEIMLTKQLA
ncbi:GNAT family N-acetyltransferase [Paenibacillus sp. M1]|uniref:GNAT family N-acetyltransferase n=1 Tax=Paenibacillus haidiansis TaxID=1574488 RepID=A0ABU7VLZ9_9BACL